MENKKKFENCKIVACFMVHYEDDLIDGLLKDLSKYTDEFYVNIQEATEKVKQAVVNHPYTKKYIITKNEVEGVWSQKQQRENTIRLLDDIKPDIVLFPDADEIYPKCMKQTLKDFWESEHGNLWFHMYCLWGDKTKVRRDKLYKSMCHVRAFKWKEGLTYLPTCGYGAKPSNLPNKGYQFHCPEPTMHFGYINDKERKLRYDRAKLNEETRKKMQEGAMLVDVPKEFL